LLDHQLHRHLHRRPRARRRETQVLQGVVI
jgi:hypothetical protein